jgi:hypothetical protein
LYEEGACIIEDFFDAPAAHKFDDPAKGTTTFTPPHYPPPLFTCSQAQQDFINKSGISRERIFDGVRRSSSTCGYDTYIVDEKPTKKKVTGPGPRVQLKPCKVI